MSESDGWPAKVKDRLLVECLRRCCVCHKFCGGKIELHHIDPKAANGKHTYENAIALCFDCHAEVGHYNIAHPRGTRFSAAELRGHRDRWIQMCRDHPDVLADAPRFANPGPLESLVQELEFNRAISARQGSDRLGSPFEVAGLQRAMTEGSLSLLDESIVHAVQAAYIEMMRANTFIGAIAHAPHGNSKNMAINDAQKAIQDASRVIGGAVLALTRAGQAHSD